MKGDSKCPYCFGTGHRRIVEHRKTDYPIGNFVKNVFYNRKCTYDRKKYRKLRIVTNDEM